MSSPVDVGDERRDKTKNIGGASRFLDSSDEEEESKGPVRKSMNNHSRTGIGLDSSDDEETTKDVANTKNILNADSSDDSGPDDMPSTKEAEEGREKLKKKTILEKPQDSDSDTEHRHNSIFNNKDLYDAESSDEEAGQRAKTNSDDSSSNDDPASSPRPADQSDDGDNETGLDTAKAEKGGHERKSKSSAMSEIRSESQRMVRETKVSLPYHKARQTSLTAFLNRKKGMPEIVKSMKLSKLTHEADVLLKEREKKMAEFYKSEDEEVSNDEDKEYHPGDALVEGDQHADDQKHPIGDTSIQETINDNIKETDENIVEDQVNISQDDNNGSNTQSATLESPAVEVEVPSSGMPDNECGNDLATNKDSESQVTENVPALQSESLNLVLEETPDVSDAPEVLSSVADKKQLKLDMLKKQIDCSILEKTLQVTPRLYSGDIDNDELFSPKVEISHGAQKLLSRYVNHAKFKGSPSINSQSENNDINVIVKKTAADGTEVLEKEVVKYNPQKSKKSADNKIGYLSMKDKLKKKMFVKKKENIKMREELMKINNEEYDDLPEDQLIDEKEEDLEDEEYEGDDDSDLEENDVDMTEKKERRRGLFLEDEADESGDEGGDEEESDAESLNLVQADDDEDEDEVLQSGRKIGYRKIKSSHLLSDDDDEVEDTNTKQHDLLLSDLETPNVDTCSVRSFAGSTHSSASSAIFNTVPRWTPFKDRIDANGVEYPSASLCDPADSPTASQMARKKLGFEELCDPNGLEAEDVDDVIGLCSGKFATQPDRPLQQNLATQREPEEFILPTKDAALTSIESQDTVILTGSCPVLSGRPEAGCLDDLLGLDDGNVDEKAEDGPGICPSDEEAPGFLQEDIGADKVLHSDDDDMIFIKKRKRVISDDEESDQLSDVGQLEDVEDGGPQEKDAVDTRTTLFDKKGKLRKDFFDNEAELSGSEEELSDDEDERGLDRLEMEEGDLEDIDEAEEMDKVGRIHQKALLDEDQADIRLFQERFLEDGDLHTDNKRTRQFKWKGLDDMVEFNKQDSDSGEEEDAGDVDENWRLQRLEREKWVKENKEKGVEGEENHMFRLQSNISVKATSMETKSKRVEEEEEVTSSISVETRAGPLLPIATNRFQRSSFLARGESTLEKMASLTKKADDRTGTGAKKGRNFVFAALSPKKTVEQDPVDAANPPSPQPAAAAKRKKVVPVAKKLKVDRTLQSNNKTSIFNLM